MLHKRSFSWRSRLRAHQYGEVRRRTFGVRKVVLASASCDARAKQLGELSDRLWRTEVRYGGAWTSGFRQCRRRGRQGIGSVVDVALSGHSQRFIEGLVRRLCELPAEIEWVEFKRDWFDANGVGEYLSALANSAALNDESRGYLIWGIDDESHEIVGTSFQPESAKGKGNELLEPWLHRKLSPRSLFRFHRLEVDGRQVVVLEIERATQEPTKFSDVAYIRVASTKRQLKDAPERERALWSVLGKTAFESLLAAEQVDDEAVTQLLNYPAYFALLGSALPADRARVLATLAGDRLILPGRAGGWDITNLGAMLLARRLDDFPDLARKAVRVVQYRGTGRLLAVREHVVVGGYAGGFEGLIDYVNGLLPTNEIMGRALRRTVPMFPELAIREIVANALIHQDFFIRGSGPMVEIFDDRVEVTNPGTPLVSTERFMDSPPRSRNEVMASLMRRFGICEERGSGIDKVVSEVEFFQLPGPLFEAPSGSTRAVLFAHKALRDMDRQERVRACYLHACLCYVTNARMTNTSLRRRFGIADQNAAEASRLLREAVEAGALVIQDETVGTRSRTYLPYWVRA